MRGSPAPGTNSGLLPTMLFAVLFVLALHSQSPTAAKLKSADKDVIFLVLAESFQLLLLQLLLLAPPYADIFHL